MSSFGLFSYPRDKDSHDKGSLIVTKMKSPALLMGNMWLRLISKKKLRLKKISMNVTFLNSRMKQRKLFKILTIFFNLYPYVS